ncbi:MAG: DcrB-related protein [Pseudonocardia sp.]
MKTWAAVAAGSLARILASVAAVGLVGAAGCSSAGSSASAPAAAPAPSAGLGQAYHSPDGYRISPPADWVLHPTDGRGGLSVRFAAPTADKAAPEPFADNLNVVITPTTRSLDNLVAETKQQYPSVLTNYKVVTDQSGVIGGQPAHLLGGTYDDPRSGSLENIQMLILSAGKQYTVTFTAPAASFDSLHAAMLASLASFAVG